MVRKAGRGNGAFEEAPDRDSKYRQDCGTALARRESTRRK
jgi:hypothetical protein